MSRIAFFTERLPPDDDPIASFAYDLVRTLADLQHEVRVFSTYVEGAALPQISSRIEILRPFKKWSWLEIPKFLPLLLDFQPDVMHVAQPRTQKFGGWANAMGAIPSLAPLIGRPGVVTSFYDLLPTQVASHRLLLHSSDAVTVSNQPQLEMIEKFFAASRRGATTSLLTSVVPVPGRTTQAAESVDETLREFFAPDKRIIFVPGNLDEHPRIAELFRMLSTVLQDFTEASLVFGGGWGQIPPRMRHELMEFFQGDELGRRVLISGPLRPDALRFCLNSSRAVLLASIETTSLRLTHVFSEALSSGAVLIISEEQLRLAAVPWRDRENAFVTLSSADSEIRSWSNAIREALSSDELINHIRAALPEFNRSEGLDQPGNAMSRVYAEVLQRKRSTRR